MSTISYKAKTFLPYDPEIAFLDVYRNELKTFIYMKTCTSMLIASLFIIAKNWKQTIYPSVDEWITKLWYNEIMEYSSVLKRNELPSNKKTQRSLKYIFKLSERSQYEKVIYCIILTI